jgi:hypothetical protein
MSGQLQAPADALRETGPVPVEMVAVWVQRQMERFEEEKHFFHIPGFQRWTFQPVISSLY